MIPEAAVDNRAMTITEFLEARIAEDEAMGRVAKAEFAHAGYGCYGPARVLAECAAKRAILSLAPDDEGYVTIGDWESCSDSCPPVVAEYAIRAIASIYTDHPDYQQEWALDGN